jgi:hypothetical protein
MKIMTTLLLALIASSALALIGCRQLNDSSLVPHKLVVTGNQHSVPLYPDEQTFLQVSRQKQEGGIEGMVGKVNKTFNAKEIDDQTPVNVLTSDDNGALVKISDGPMKGQTGFVAKQNLN